ncbi:MAG: GNAT family N-acetyltransferase [Rhizobacter sp.]|nr:GNAT family N-acetyltransferase [Ferruginibacter sp.]
MPTILNSNPSDIDVIFSRYDDAVAYQKTKFNKHWLPFDREMVEREIAEGRQWKIMEGDEVAAVFAIAYEDPFIWAEKNADPAIYIHRIVTHPAFRGGAYVKAIIEWAKGHAKEKHKKFIRMDTWGDNEALISYYVKCGFAYLGNITPQATQHLPKHYSSIFLGLLEIEV